jgi:hypothetical protein
VTTTQVSPSAEAPGAPVTARRRRRWLVGAALVLLVLVLWAAAVGHAVLGASRDLQDAAAHLRGARSHLETAEIAAAVPLLEQGTLEAATAVTKLERWYVRPVLVLPVGGPDLAAATTIATSVRDVAGALEAVTRVGVEVLDGVEAEAADGVTVTEVGLVAVARIAPLLSALEVTAERSVAEVAAIDPSAVSGQIAEARHDYLDLVGTALPRLSVLADTTAVLPALLGADEPKTYLFAAASLSELRASGGLLGSWTLLRVEGGRLEFGSFAPVDELPVDGAPWPAPSEEFEQRYGPLGALRAWRNVNLSPDFPASAQVMLAAWRAGDPTPIDGVIVADTVSYKRLAELSGGVDVPGIGRLSPEEALEFVGLEAYDGFEDQDERKRVLGEVATSVFSEVSRVLDGADLLASGRALAALAADGHLRVYVDDPAVQDVVEELGLAASLPATTGESLGAFVNNVAPNKVDFFTSREVTRTITLLPDGRTRARTEVALENTAPTTGYPSYVLGVGDEQGREPGDNRSMVTFTCSTTCTILTAPAGAQPIATERGRPIVDVWVDVPAGERRVVRMTAESEGAWRVDGPRLVLSVEELAQPTIGGVRSTTIVETPAGFEPVDLPAGAVEVDGRIVLERLVSGAQTLQFAWQEAP